MLAVFRLTHDEVEALEVALEQFIQNTECSIDEVDADDKERATLNAARRMQVQLSAARIMKISRGDERRRMLQIALGKVEG